MLRKIFSTVILQVIAQIIVAFVFIKLASSMPITQWSEISTVITIFVIISTTTSSTYSDYYYNSKANDKESKELNLFWIIFSFSVLVVFLYMVDSMDEYYLALLIFPISALPLDGILRFEERFVLLSLIKLISAIILYFLLFFLNPVNSILGYYLSSGLFALILMINRNVKLKIVSIPNKLEIFYLINSLMQRSFFKLDRFWLFAVIIPVELGTYDLLIRVLSLLNTYTWVEVNFALKSRVVDRVESSYAPLARNIIILALGTFLSYMVLPRYFQAFENLTIISFFVTFILAVLYAVLLHGNYHFIFSENKMKFSLMLILIQFFHLLFVYIAIVESVAVREHIIVGMSLSVALILGAFLMRRVMIGNET